MNRKIVSGICAAIAVCLLLVPSPRRAVASAGIGVAPANVMQCNGIDATSAAWTWGSPTIETSSDGSTFTPVTSTDPWGLEVCRWSQAAGDNIDAYVYSVVRDVNGTWTSELAQPGDTVASLPYFRVTIPIEPGDNLMSMEGYSQVQSYDPSPSEIVAVVKGSPIAKVEYTDFASFIAAHPECASYTSTTYFTCPVAKADHQYTAAIIQHVAYSSTPLSSWQALHQGLWVAANVNGYSVDLSCGSVGTDSGGSSGSGSGGSSTGSPPASTAPQSSLAVSITAPHLEADGVTVNTGSLQAFIPAAVATKCFSNGGTTATLASIASNLTVTRSAQSEGTSTPTYTVTAATTPVPGLVIDVPEMTFSNPTYTVTTKTHPAAAVTAVRAGRFLTVRAVLTRSQAVVCRAVKAKHGGKKRTCRAAEVLAREILAGRLVARRHARARIGVNTFHFPARSGHPRFTVIVSGKLVGSSTL